MTQPVVWRARRARRPDNRLDIYGPRLLCGWQFGPDYCTERVAWIAEPKSNGEVVIPSGLTAEGSLGEYRWSNRARRRVEGDRRADHDGRSARRDDLGDPAGKMVRGTIRVVKVPSVVPCRRGHRNLIDTAVLSSTPTEQGPAHRQGR